MIRLKVHKVINGPLEDPEFEGRWINLCLIEVEGQNELITDEIYFDDIDEAISMCSHLQFNIDPVIIDVPTEEDIKLAMES